MRGDIAGLRIPELPRTWRALFTLHFLRRVLSRFISNQGLLLAGAIAFYSLLSVVPLFALLLVALSKLVDEHRLILTITSQLELVAPGGATAIVAEIESFLEHRELAGSIGILVLLFFGSLAFSVLERAMAVIFRHREAKLRRTFLTRALIPFIYMGALGLGLLFVAFVTGSLEALDGRSIHILSLSISLSGASAILIRGLGLLSELLLLSSLYIALPVGRVPWRHALLGGAFATVLWELIRRFLVWWLANVSLVNVVYGSFATTIFALLTMETASIIILLGAQLIAEYEQLEPDEHAREASTATR